MEAILTLPLEVVVRMRSGAPFATNTPIYVSDMLAWSSTRSRWMRRENIAPQHSRVLSPANCRNLILDRDIFDKLLSARKECTVSTWREQMYAVARMGDATLSDYSAATARKAIIA